MKYLFIILIVVVSYSIFVDNRYIGKCDSIDRDLLEQCGFVEHNGKYISTYSKYDEYGRYNGEGTIILDSCRIYCELIRGTINE
jgi:hypothetical protein